VSLIVDRIPSGTSSNLATLPTDLRTHLDFAVLDRLFIIMDVSGDSRRAAVKTWSMSGLVRPMPAGKVRNIIRKAFRKERSGFPGRIHASLEDAPQPQAEAPGFVSCPIVDRTQAIGTVQPSGSARPDQSYGDNILSMGEMLAIEAEVHRRLAAASMEGLQPPPRHYPRRRHSTVSLQ
jgi:hypothetical protein